MALHAAKSSPIIAKRSNRDMPASAACHYRRVEMGLYIGGSWATRRERRYLYFMACSGAAAAVEAVGGTAALGRLIGGYGGLRGWRICVFGCEVGCLKMGSIISLLRMPDVRGNARRSMMIIVRRAR